MCVCGLCVLSSLLLLSSIFFFFSSSFLTVFTIGPVAKRGSVQARTSGPVSPALCPRGGIYLPRVSLKGHTIKCKQLMAHHYLEDRVSVASPPGNSLRRY